MIKIATFDDLDRRAGPLLERAQTLRGKAATLRERGERARGTPKGRFMVEEAIAVVDLARAFEARATALLELKRQIHDRETRARARAEMMATGYKPPGRIPPAEREIARRLGAT